MKYNDFVESEDSKFVQQLGAFWSALQTHGNLLGFSNAEIDEAEKDYLYMKYAVERHSKVQAFSQGYTKFKDGLRKGRKQQATEPQYSAPGSAPSAVDTNIERRFRRRAAKAKASSNYSKSIGEQLRIVAPKAAFDAAKSTPEFKIKMSAGLPQVKFKKKFYDSMDIWKDEGSGWRKLERVTRSPYTDESRLPPHGSSAAWKYRIIGVIGDRPVGNFSGEVTVLVYGIEVKN